MSAYLSAVSLSLCLPASVCVSFSLTYLFWSRLSKWVVGPEKHPGISGGWFSENGDQTGTGELEWKPDLATEQPVDRCGQGPLDHVKASSLRLLSKFHLVHEMHSEIPWSGYMQNGRSEESVSPTARPCLTLSIGDCLLCDATGSGMAPVPGKLFSHAGKLRQKPWFTEQRKGERWVWWA